MSSHDMKNPTGGVNMRHVIESPAPNGNLLERVFSREWENTREAVGKHLLSGYGPIGFMNRTVRTRMRCGVGAGGEKPPATRFGTFLCGASA